MDDDYEPLGTGRNGLSIAEEYALLDARKTTGLSHPVLGRILDHLHTETGVDFEAVANLAALLGQLGYMDQQRLRVVAHGILDWAVESSGSIPMKTRGD